MNPYSTHNLYKNVFDGIKNAASNPTATSQVIMVADFPEIQFTLFPGLYTTIASVVGTFVVGELVTGGSSGATGYVSAVTASRITLTNVTGTFTNAETITGGTSGATATISAISTPNFTIQAFKSNQKAINGVMNPPDPTLPSSPTNDYEEIMYTGEPGGVNYAVGFPFNPNTGSPAGALSYATQSFKVQTNGAIWLFLRVAISGGALINADINIFNQ